MKVFFLVLDSVRIHVDLYDKDFIHNHTPQSIKSIIIILIIIEKCKIYTSILPGDMIHSLLLLLLSETKRHKVFQRPLIFSRMNVDALVCRGSNANAHAKRTDSVSFFASFFFNTKVIVALAGAEGERGRGGDVVSPSFSLSLSSLSSRGNNLDLEVNELKVNVNVY